MRIMDQLGQVVLNAAPGHVHHGALPRENEVRPTSCAHACYLAWPRAGGQAGIAGNGGGKRAWRSGMVGAVGWQVDAEVAVRLGNGVAGAVGQEHLQEQ